MYVLGLLGNVTSLMMSFCTGRRKKYKHFFFFFFNVALLLFISLGTLEPSNSGDLDQASKMLGFNTLGRELFMLFPNVCKSIHLICIESHPLVNFGGT